MINTITKLLMVSRPVSWVNTAFPFAAGYLVTGGSNWLLLIIATLFFLIPYNLLMYGINDIYDYESDIKNPRKGGIEGMREQRAFHPVIAKACIFIVTPFVVWLLSVGSMLNAAVLIGLLFFVIAYSIKGLRFKEIPVLDSLTSSAHFVGPLVYALTFTDFNQTSCTVLVAFFLWGMASHALGAIQDIMPDRQANISSVATTFGARKTLMMVIGLYVIAGLALLTLPKFGWILAMVSWMYAVNCYDILNINDRSSAQANRPWRRFMGLNQLAGFVVTVVLILTVLY